MSFDYGKMQSTATRLLDRFNQGTLIYIAPGETTGPEFNPVVGPPTPYPVKGTVSGVSEKYLQDGYITSADLMVNLAVFEVEPTNAGKLSIEGVERQIIEVHKIPAAGVTVSWRLFVKG